MIRDQPRSPQSRSSAASDVYKRQEYPYDSYYLANPYLKGLKDGKYSMSTIDDKASRILRLIFRTVMNRNKPWGTFGSEEHFEIARTIAEEGIVLLKNSPVTKKSSALLPICLLYTSPSPRD